MNGQPNNVNSIATQVMEFLVKFGIPLTIIIIAFPWLKKYLMNMSASNGKTEAELAKDKEFAENSNPVIKKSKLDQITSRADIQAAAESIAADLGTVYSDTGGWWDWANPKGWTENDKAVADTIIYQRNNYNTLEKLYYIITRNRNLTADLLELLDNSELTRVRKYINI